MGDAINLQKQAVIEVRLLPWRPHRRRLDPNVLRPNAGTAGDVFVVDDLPTALIGIAVWVFLVLAAPIAAVVLALLFLPVELTAVLVAAAVLLAVRLVGLAPWTVNVPGTGVERYRSLFAAARRVRECNADGRVRVRWSLR
jgi:hypothetical protein